VQVEGFVITKVDLRRQTITLNLPAGGCSLRLRAVEGLTAYRIGQLIPPMAGVVAETRQGRLGEELRRALGTTFDPTVEAVTLPGMALLPNPLPAIPTILNQTRHAKVNCIHGDLNLENILVDTQIRDVRLIDFAEARRDHVLHDFLRLETEVITKIVPVILREAKLSPTLIYPLYQQLHCVAAHPEPSYPPALEKPLAILTTIRQAVRGGLYDPDDWSEYDQGLLLYLLGALKFNNLDEIPEAKRIAFWGAATIHHLLQATAPCPDLAQLWRQGADSPVSRSTGVTVKLDEDPVSEQMVGKTLADRYQIAQLLDKGGMGVVFRGQDILLQREVAVKVMHPYLAQDPLSRRRFLREAQAMARLNHQGIVRVFDFGQAGTLLYIVMELIVGKALSHRLQELRQAGQNGVALSEAIELIRQICLAIHCAHQQGVVHRDFKPGNIMLKAESGENLPYRPVITDFGLAKLLLDDEAAITQSGHLVGGTPAYMSPEQVRGQPSDARSDIYALGILLYELVTGELPFPINSVAGALYFHTQGVPPSPRSLRPNLPPVVEQVILRAIAKDPTQRFPDTLTMAQALTAETPAPMQPAPPPEVVTDKPEPPTRAASSQRFVAHQEKVGGDKITIGSISGHNVAIGRQSRITSIGGGGEADDLGRLFDTIYQFIANRPEDPNVDKEELLATVRQIQAEIAKGHEVNDTKIKRWLNYLAGMAPDVSKTTRQLLLTAPSVPPAIRLLAAGTGEKG
jgi:serine/threonine protein kinase